MEDEAFPIGIQSFREIRDEGHYYVDKTMYVQHLVGKTKHNFLSRPRRFGKSLFVNMLKELFEGNEKLFRGLSVHDKWDWSVRYPVVRLDFASGNFAVPENLPSRVDTLINLHETEAGVKTSSGGALERFFELIAVLSKETGQRVVVLVDEYDAPILDAIGSPENAIVNRDFLASLYATIKTLDDYVKFSFFTGISRFSKTSLFSKFNNLWDMTLDPRHSAICGYTEKELESVFSHLLDGLDRDKIREWYNGYNWLGEEPVYNPHSMLHTLKTRKFNPWWYGTGTPKFLIEVLNKNDVFPVELDQYVADADLLATFDVDNIHPASLLFQAGYLTVSEAIAKDDEEVYRLKYPNREVRQSLSRSFLEHLMPGNGDEHRRRRLDIYDCIQTGNLKRVESLLQEVFSSIPYNWHTRGKLASYEAYFASIIFVHFVGAGLRVTVEDPTNRGRIDMTVETDDRIYLFEFKLLNGDPEGSALKQIKELGYADKFKHRGKTIHLIGAEFDKGMRNLVRFDIGHP